MRRRPVSYLRLTGVVLEAVNVPSYIDFFESPCD